MPLTCETLRIILPVSLTLAAVGLLESLLTAQIVDDMTDTPSDKNRECDGQGVANIASALFGGMGGCAMIGQSVINVSSGARGRLSTLVAGVFLLVLLVVLQDLLAIVPVAALTAVMIMVSINTFSWGSLLRLRTNPVPSSVVMLATVATVVATHDLAKGVLVGVLLSGVFFAGKVSRLSRVTSTLSADGRDADLPGGGPGVLRLRRRLRRRDRRARGCRRIVIDVGAAHFWDISAVGALDRVVLKARRQGKAVEVVGLNAASATMVERFGAHRQEGCRSGAALTVPLRAPHQRPKGLWTPIVKLKGSKGLSAFGEGSPRGAALPFDVPGLAPVLLAPSRRNSRLAGSVIG